MESDIDTLNANNEQLQKDLNSQMQSAKTMESQKNNEIEVLENKNHKLNDQTNK